MRVFEHEILNDADYIADSYCSFHRFLNDGYLALVAPKYVGLGLPKHKMPTRESTTRNKKANRGNIKSTSSKIDQILLQHLLSPHPFRGFTYLAKNERIPPQESRQKVKNRLQYLKRIQTNRVYLLGEDDVDGTM